MIPKLDRWIRRWAMTLVVAPVLEQLQLNHREVLSRMATQEERLQAILAGVQDALAKLAALKSDNPAIEDEISAIETALAGAKEPPPEG